MRRLAEEVVHARDEGRALATVTAARQLCTNYPLGWADWNANDCNVYVQGNLCTPTGGYGDGWSELGDLGWTFDDFAANNGTGPTACCGCGGGKPCTDTAGWTDKNGNTCAAYASKGYCDGDGGTGAGWPATWGTFANQTLAGKATAATACCACRPRARDASGRGCDYYAARPTQCGCCDDEDFQAQLACPSACATTTPAQKDLTLRLAGWTNDTRMIIFPRSSMTGTIPSDWSTRFPRLQTVMLYTNNLTGTLPPQLGNLSELRLLELGTNVISGTIPAELNLLRNLQYMSLSDNLLTGTVPPQLGLMKNLRMLVLDSNLLTGTLPAELGQLSLLTYLSASYMDGLEGSIPAALGQLAKLEYLLLTGTSVGGTLPPELGKLASLGYLDLSDSKFEGTLPPEIGRLTNVFYLSLKNNYFEGTLPAELGKIKNLVDLMLDDNSFDGTLPPELFRLAKLVYVTMPSNFLTGPIPADIGYTTKLWGLDLSNNKLSGTLPPEMGKLRVMAQLFLSMNSIRGSIPKEMSTMASLQQLYIDGNALSGTLPPELGRVSKLTTLDLNSNQLTGTIPPEYGSLTKLQDLTLTGNRLAGTLPTQLFNIVGLQYLLLGGNGLSGTIPSEVGRLVALEYLELTGNRITGTLPSTLQRLTKLEYLYCGGNMLSGTLPDALGKLTALSSLSLRSNMFTGTLPKALGQLTNLMVLLLQKNQFTGIIPDELGQLQDLETLRLNGNKLGGPLPSALGLLSSLSQLDCSSNMLQGGVPPEIGLLQSLEYLYLQGNSLTELPEEIGLLTALQDLNVEDNPGLAGTFPDTSYCESLVSIRATGCSFFGAGGVPPGVEELHFGGNSFSGLPEAWLNLTSLTVLDLSRNNMTTWRPYGVLPLGVFTPPTGNYECGYVPLLDRLGWPKLQVLDVSGNRLGDSITTRDFLWSLSYLPALMELHASGNHFESDVPLEGPWFAVDMENTGENDCTKVPTEGAGYKMLHVLDLSDNKITSIMAPPPGRLIEAKLSSNALQDNGLHGGWYKILGTLEVQNNPDLRADVWPPYGWGACPSAGSEELQANGYDFAGDSEDFECSSLCPGQRTRYTSDPVLNESSLCRCKDGRAGSGMGCSGCGANTYSAAEDEWGMSRYCAPCPALAQTEAGVQNATSIDFCKCPAGWYMGFAGGPGVPRRLADPENLTLDTDLAGPSGDGEMPPSGPSCMRCKQFPFQTTQRGATAESQCFCNPTYDGLRLLLGSCGCVDGAYMDHARRVCRPCDSEAEQCVWGAAIELSLLPPVVKAGYWADSYAKDVGRSLEAGPGDQMSNFSGNDIWRCFSKDSCLMRGVCAAGRYGRACGLCESGMYGGPVGPCKPCLYPPEKSKLGLLLILLVGPAATFGAHFWLHSGTGATAFGTRLRPARTSLKQLLKYLQMLGVLSIFTVQWPPMARQFLANITRITVMLPQAIGVACLTGQQSVALEMGFRWLLPVAGVASACFTCVLLLPTRFLPPTLSWSSRVKMDHWDVLRVSLWGLVLFYSTLLQFGTEVLTCAPGPNGRATVMTYPHLECRGSKEWVKLAAISLAFLAVFAAGVLLAVAAALRRSKRPADVAGADVAGRGWWCFLFDDYRAGWSHWLLMTMAKDVMLVIIGTAGAGNGVNQLMATAAGFTRYSYLVLRDQPFHDPANTVLEAWTTMSIAVLCVLSAGFGYQGSPGFGAFADFYISTDSDALYQTRAKAMLVVLWLTLLGPAAIILYQLCTACETVRNALPYRLRPADVQDAKAWNETFFQGFGLDQDAAREFRGLVDRWDAVDASKFRSLVGAGALVPAREARDRAAAHPDPVPDHHDDHGALLGHHAAVYVGQPVREVHPPHFPKPDPEFDKLSPGGAYSGDEFDKLSPGGAYSGGEGSLAAVTVGKPAVGAGEIDDKAWAALKRLSPPEAEPDETDGTPGTSSASAFLHAAPVIDDVSPAQPTGVSVTTVGVVLL